MNSSSGDTGGLLKDDMTTVGVRFGKEIAILSSRLIIFWHNEQQFNANHQRRPNKVSGSSLFLQMQFVHHFHEESPDKINGERDDQDKKGLKKNHKEGRKEASPCEDQSKRY